MSNIVNVTKSDDEMPVPTIWRRTFQQIVEAFISENFSLREIEGVDPLSDDDSDSIKRSITSYGDRLIHLPDDAWKTSVARWTGSHWDVLVDIFTEAGNPSDLIISSRVLENGEGYRFAVDSVHVP